MLEKMEIIIAEKKRKEKFEEMKRLLKLDKNLDIRNFLIHNIGTAKSVLEKSNADIHYEIVQLAKLTNSLFIVDDNEVELLRNHYFETRHSRFNKNKFYSITIHKGKIKSFYRKCKIVYEDDLILKFKTDREEFLACGKKFCIVEEFKNKS